MSTNGGTWPKWSDDELFYWEGNSLMAVGFTLLFLQGVAKLIRDIQLLGQLNTQHTAGNAENQS